MLGGRRMSIGKDKAVNDPEKGLQQLSKNSASLVKMNPYSQLFDTLSCCF
jgi:hypothetical protein